MNQIKFSSICRIIRHSGFFDAPYYLSQIQAPLSVGADPIAHYLNTGAALGLRAARFFNAEAYLEANPDVKTSGMEPFHHFVQFGLHQARPLVAPPKPAADPEPTSQTDPDAALKEDYDLIGKSGLFDADYYRATVPIASQLGDALAHYVRFGRLVPLNPSRQFDSIFYRCQNPDARGKSPGLAHWLRSNREAPTLPDGQPYHYLAKDIGSDDDVQIERLRAAAFFYRYGLRLEGPTITVHLPRAADDLAKITPALKTAKEPDATIIIPVYGQTQFVLSCLDSLVRHRSRYTAEIIIVDDCSPEGELVELLGRIKWAKHVRPEKNLGFIGACNLGAAHAKGRVVIPLNSDTRVCDGWLDELMRTFDDRPEAGLVGSKLFYGDGSLQEAGGFVWRDGSAWNYGRNKSSNRPEFCYAREVDYCSGAAIAVPKALWDELGGFDPYFSPAYYEDTDLAFRVRAAGRQVWYQSLARVIHYEGRTNGTDLNSGVKAYQVENARKFRERWADTLSQHAKNPKDLAGPVSHTRKPTLLALEALTPRPDQDAGSILTSKLLQIFAKLGWRVSFAALHNLNHDRRYTEDLQRAGIETLTFPFVSSLEEIITLRPGGFDAVLGFRVTVVGGILKRLREAFPLARLLFHNQDLHYLRSKREAELKNDDRLRSAAEVLHCTEIDTILSADCTMVPSTMERDLIKGELGIENVVIYNFTVPLVRSTAPFDDRKHLAFVGGFRHTPNVDAIFHFVEDIWPALRERLPEDALVYIVGPDVPDHLLALGSDRIVFTGHVERLDKIFYCCRLFMSPLRYGAGVKGKLVTCLSHGLPAVASTVSIEGMDMVPGQDILTADTPQDFVDQAVKLYGDANLWGRLQERGYDFIERQYSWEVGERAVLAALELADQAWLRRMRLAREKRIADHHLTGA